MSVAAISSLQVVPLREAFASEPHDFTVWLAENAVALGERLGIELAVVQREKDVGSFKLDLLCEDGEGRLVIVENQLEPTDHRHLGQLLTYLVNLDAKTAIWVTSDPRPEHRRVIDWLNEATPSDIAFYLVRVEVIRIADSPYAPLFTVLVGPDAQGKEIGEKKKELAGRHHKRLAFWEGLLEQGRTRVPRFANISPSTSNWIAASAGKSGVSYNFVVWMDGGGVELYIDNDQRTGQGNKILFDSLHAEQEGIEHEVDLPISWERLDEKRASRIRIRLREGGLADPESWERLQVAMVEAMVRFHGAVDPRLKRVLRRA